MRKCSYIWKYLRMELQGIALKYYSKIRRERKEWRGKEGREEKDERKKENKKRERQNIESRGWGLCRLNNGPQK